MLQWAREHGWDDLTRLGWAPRGTEVGTRAWVPVERLHVFERRWAGTCTCCVGAGARLPVGLVDVHIRSYGRVPGDVEVGAGAPLPVARDYERVAVACGHLDVLRWTREHGCPQRAATRDAAATKGYSDHLPLSA